MGDNVMMELRIVEVIIFFNTLILGVVGYFIKKSLEKLDRLSLHKECCLREFAKKDETEDLYSITRKHGERISSLESWRKSSEMGRGK